MKSMREYALRDFPIIDQNSLVSDYNYSKIYLRYASMHFLRYRPGGR